MYRNYSLYAVKGKPIEDVASQLYAAIDEPYREHTSLSWGDYYRSSNRGKVDVSVYPNEDEEDYPHEERYAEYPILVSVYDAEDFERYDRLILQELGVSAELIVRKVYDEEK